jgi:N-acetylmuramoyl-L-alanine amidase
VFALLVALAGCSSSGATTTQPAPEWSTTSSTTTPAPTPTPEPAPTTPPAPAPVVVLDPGHNGGNAAHPEIVDAPVPDGTGGTKPCNTTGTETDAGFPEHAFTWDVALRMRDRLAAAGVTVVLTREDEGGVGPCVDVRGQLAGQVGAAAFVGIHGDGAGAGGRGFHVITSSLDLAGPQVAAGSTALASAVRDAMTAVQPVSTYTGSDGLDSRPDLAGLNLNAVPAVYVECGNMRNAADAALMTDPAGRDAIAAQLSTGVLAFLGR